MISYKLTKGTAPTVTMCRMTSNDGTPNGFCISIRQGDDEVSFYADTLAELQSFASDASIAAQAVDQEVNPPVESTAAEQTEGTPVDGGTVYPDNGGERTEDGGTSADFPHGPADRGCHHVMPGQPACSVCRGERATPYTE